MPNRIKSLNEIFIHDKVDAILITDLNNIKYLSKFTGSSAVILAFNPSKYKNEPPIFYTDGRYTIQSKQETENFNIIITNELSKELSNIIQRFTIEKLGFEGHNLNFDKYEEYKNKFVIDLMPITIKINSLRHKKEPQEIERIKNIIKVAEKGLIDLKAKIIEGVSELELKAHLNYFMQIHGAIKPSFEAIIAFDENSALPHAVPTHKKLNKESLVLVDWGASDNTYNSDETVTFYYGKFPSAEITKIYDTVEKAHDEAILKIRPGMKSFEVDFVARKIIEDAGYGNYFTHSLGHSLGVEVHDGMRLAKGNESIVEEGMVFTIEPGIYIEGVGGVRLEDVILVKKTGAELLTSLPKSLKNNIIY